MGSLDSAGQESTSNHDLRRGDDEMAIIKKSFVAKKSALRCASGVEMQKVDAIGFASMPTSLQSTLNDLAESFAASILEAIRSVSLHDLIQSNGQTKPNGRSPRAASAPAAVPVERPSARTSGRLRRRSPEDIAAALGRIVSLVKKHRDGLRAEQIRSELGLEAKEMPRILKEGLDQRALKSKGQKRATTYFAA
jgi:hypothetical protein